MLRYENCLSLKFCMLFCFYRSNQLQFPLGKVQDFQWIQKAWDGIPASLVAKPLEFCEISGALDGTEDEVVWEAQKVTRSLRTNLRPTVRVMSSKYMYNGSFQSHPLVLFRTTISRTTRRVSYQ